MKLVHIDVKKLGHIRDGGGWWAHGRDSAQSRAARSGPRVGYGCVHVAVGHSRLAYVEVINTGGGGQDQHACTGFLLRAHAWFLDHDVLAERIMTDNAKAYHNSRLFVTTCAELDIAQRFTKPRCR